MKKPSDWTLFLFILFFYYNFSYTTPFSSHLQEKLSQDIEDYRLDNINRIEAAFILSGVSMIDSLEKYLTWYDHLIQTIRGFYLDPQNHVEAARKVFMYLHTTWLLDYQLEATTLLDVVKHRTYNCVSGTILYNLVCEDLGFQTKAFETPTHTYTLFTNFTQQLMVENTSSMGFDIMKNLKIYSKYLAQFYPKNQVLKIGLDHLYVYENSRGRQIDNTELLGLLAYNQAYFNVKNGDFSRAYEMVLLAQQFNRDSRSNIQFEIDLYYRWGKTLFDEKRYFNSFEVFADGYYRYPENRDFLVNTKASFFHAFKDFWREKKWSKADQIILEMSELDILNPEDLQWLTGMLWNWAPYCYQTKDRRCLNQIIDYLQQWSHNEKRLQELHGLLQRMK